MRNTLLHILFTVNLLVVCSEIGKYIRSIRLLHNVEVLLCKAWINDSVVKIITCSERLSKNILVYIKNFIASSECKSIAILQRLELWIRILKKPSTHTTSNIKALCWNVWLERINPNIRYADVKIRLLSHLFKEICLTRNI